MTIHKQFAVEELMTNPNVALARRWFEEIWNQRRTATVNELLTSESVCQSELGPMTGPEEFLAKAYTPLVAAIPDLSVVIEDCVAEGDQVVVRWHATGTHSGEGMGLPPSGRHISFRGMTWIRYRDGKMIEGWDSWNLQGLLKALQEGHPSDPNR
jgi:steroid delta-isomerase-like uncharacterized protein